MHNNIAQQCWYAPPTKIFWKYQTFFRPYLKEISDNFQTGQWIFSDFEAFFSSNWLKSPVTITNLWIHAWKLHTNSPSVRKQNIYYRQKPMISRSFAENQEYPPLTSTKISKFREKSEISDFFQTNIIRLSEIQTLAEISDLRISTASLSWAGMPGHHIMTIILTISFKTLSAPLTLGKQSK